MLQEQPDDRREDLRGELEALLVSPEREEGGERRRSVKTERELGGAARAGTPCREGA